MTFRRISWKALGIFSLKLAGLSCVAAALGYALLPKPDLLPPGLEYSRTVLDRDGNVIFLTTTRDGMLRLPTSPDQVAPEMLEATLEMEDRRFFQHAGVDIRSIARAAWGVVSGRKLGGGSTITMQLCRLRWDMDTRSIAGKAMQMFRAIQCERHYGKREILAAYFTLAPYGGNVEGVRAASFRWCGKPASDLTLREAVSLSAIPQSPTARRPRAHGNPALATAQARLMARLRAHRGQPPNELDAEFHLTPTAIPRQAPHHARHLLSKHTGRLVFTSTINSRQQQIIEESIDQFLDQWHARGLRNASAILLHAPSGEIRARVGSADFHDPLIAGQVDGTRASRSPGSTLKPFLYALALDGGLIQPHTLLDDAPRRFAGYNPENSDRGFLGPVSAAVALRRSRNIPAILLANRLPDGGLETFLRRSGVALPDRNHGLALAIGATEMTLEDLARLYAQLAAPRQSGLLSPEACWLTLDALRATEPSAPAGLSYKTGTSNGFRDAWACGVMGDWVLCVWVGHFSGRGMPGLFARQTAAPLLWQTATRLRLADARRERERPANVVSVRVCPVSGGLAGRDCPHQRDGWFIGGVSPITSCQVHKREGGRVVEIWPAERLEQFRKAGFPRADSQQAASRERLAHIAAHGSAPQILSPQATVTYHIHPGDHPQNQILLEARAAAGTRQIHWFADRRYLGASAPAESLPWLPIVGDYEIQAMDDSGRVATRLVRIRLAPAPAPG